MCAITLMKRETMDLKESGKGYMQGSLKEDRKGRNIVVIVSKLKK